jgi:CheY-like chemotaxis protein
VDERYQVDCHNCKAKFDAMEAAWCECLTTEPSFVCPGCSKCFCKAPPLYKQKFWADAPKSVWGRKWGRHRAEFAPKPNPEPADVKRPLVLVVEDEKNIQRTATQVIEELGYGMILAKNGDEGLELARKYMPDLVLSDAMMPKMDGREMCRMIKEDPATSNIRVVIMTSLYTHMKYMLEAHKKFHVDDYLTKPLDLEQLRMMLNKHLRK